MENKGATVVITHHILNGKQKEYEDWLNEIGPICRRAIGNIDWQIIRPIPNLTTSYTIILRFDTIENLRNWMESNVRKTLIEKVSPFLAKDDRYQYETVWTFYSLQKMRKSEHLFDGNNF